MIWRFWMSWLPIQRYSVTFIEPLLLCRTVFCLFHLPFRLKRSKTSECWIHSPIKTPTILITGHSCTYYPTGFFRCFSNIGWRFSLCWVLYWNFFFSYIQWRKTRPLKADVLSSTVFSEFKRLLNCLFFFGYVYKWVNQVSGSSNFDDRFTRRCPTDGSSWRMGGNDRRLNGSRVYPVHNDFNNCIEFDAQYTGIQVKSHLTHAYRLRICLKCSWASLLCITPPQRYYHLRFFNLPGLQIPGRNPFSDKSCWVI